MQTDYQHVHHAEILRYLERGRLELLQAIGCPNEQFVQQGLFLVISRIDVQYKREVRAGKITVRCNKIEIDGKKIIIFQELINEKAKLAVIARVESQFLSREVGRSVEPSATFIQTVANYSGQ